jgi:hypothetical protein
VFYSQSDLVETAVYDLVNTLQSGLPYVDKKDLAPEEGYQCYSPDLKNNLAPELLS